MVTDNTRQPAATTRMLLLGLAAVALSACGGATPDPAAQARAAAVPDPALFGATPCENGAGFSMADSKSSDRTTTVRANYDRSCKLCHGNSGTGAPIAHDPEQWRDRLAQGMDTLMDHTVNGYRGMPPMGLCMACSPSEFRDLIEFMSRPLPAGDTP